VGRHLRVVFVGAVAGGVFFVVFRHASLSLLLRSIQAGAHPVLAFLLLAAFVYVILLTTLLVTNGAAYIALRILDVQRPLLLTGISTVALAIMWCLLVRSGSGAGEQQWWLSIGSFAAVYGLNSIAASARR